jgi:hypothetical protein
MSTSPVLAELSALGVRVWADSGRLRYDAPPGVMTAERVAMVREQRAMILAELAGAPTGDTAEPMSVAEWRAECRRNAAPLLAELDALPELSREQVRERDYYRELTGGPRVRVPATPSGVGGEHRPGDTAGTVAGSSAYVPAN